MDAPHFDIVDTPLADDSVLVEVHGELDVATAPQLRTRLSSAIERAPRLIVVDLRAVDFLDSVTLAVLLAAQKALPGQTRMAIVVAPDSYARLIVDVTGVDQWLHVVGDRDEALT